MIIDMKRRGFTIVELIIVITIMGILLTLGVVNLRGSQVNGRDAERKVDIETIALHLETFYTSGTDDPSILYNRYPSVDPTSGLIGHERTYLRDIDLKSLASPTPAGSTASSLMAATNSTQTTASVTPQPDFDKYIYQPLKSDGSLCALSTDECIKFNLYYKLELDSTINMMTSRNQ